MDNTHEYIEKGIVICRQQGHRAWVYILTVYRKSSNTNREDRCAFWMEASTSEDLDYLPTCFLDNVIYQEL